MRKYRYCFTGATLVALFAVSVTASTVMAEDKAGDKKEKPKLLVMNLVNEGGLSDGVVRLLNEYAMSEFVKMGRYRIIGDSDVRTLLDHESRRSLLDCGDASCIAQIGGALGVDYVAHTNLGRVGEFYLFNIKIIDTRTAEPVARWSEQVEGIEGALMLAVRKSVKALNTEKKEGVAGADDSAAGELTAALPSEAKARDQSESSADTEDGGPGVGVIPIVLWGVGAVSLGVGIGLAVETGRMFNLASDPNQPGSQLAAQSGPGLQIGADVTLCIGIAAAGAGFVTWLVSYFGDDEPAGDTVTIGISPMQTVVRWSF